MSSDDFCLWPNTDLSRCLHPSRYQVQSGRTSIRAIGTYVPFRPPAARIAAFGSSRRCGNRHRDHSPLSKLEARGDLYDQYLGRYYHQGPTQIRIWQNVARHVGTGNCVFPAR
jgi:hypothetical protein